VRRHPDIDDDEVSTMLGAIELFRGDYLADLDAEWAEAQRRQLRLGFVLGAPV